MVDVAACRTYLQTRQRRRAQAREAMRQQVLQIVRTAAPPVLAAFPQIRRAYVFGSLVHPGAMFRNNSDIDVAVEGTLSAEDYFALWRALERAIPGWALEVVELGADIHFAERVRQTGELIHERSSSDAES